MPYTNEIPWEILGPILQKLPDHSEASCPLWDECGGLQKFIERDQQHEDPPHHEASETTMFDLIQEFVVYDEVLLDLDETLIAGRDCLHTSMHSIISLCFVKIQKEMDRQMLGDSESSFHENLLLCKCRWEAYSDTQCESINILVCCTWEPQRH